MAIWTKERLIAEAEINPYSVYRKARDAAKKDSGVLTDEDVDDIFTFENKLLPAVYVKWNEKYEMPFEILGHLVNQYGPNQHVFAVDFAIPLTATDLYSVSFKLHVVLTEMGIAGQDKLALIDVVDFEKSIEYMTSGATGKLEPLSPEMQEELRKYRKYLSL